MFPKVVTILCSVSPTLPPEQINKDTLLIADLNIDSLKVAELSVMLEEAFNVPVFVPELLTRVDDPYHLNVASLVELVQQKLTAHAGNG